jgi:2-iminobutanoate/2-iminopropanoate deaminase
MREQVTTSGAPQALGAYSQAIATERLVFCSGQVGLDPAEKILVEGGVVEQAERALTNLGAVLDAAGSSYAEVLKTTCFLADINDFAAFNEVYQRFFPEPRPARSTFAVADLPIGALVEIEAIAQKS